MRFYLLLATAVVALSNSPVYAFTNTEVLGTHTPHLPLELKSTPSFDNSFKIASVCGLGGAPCSTGLEFGYGSSSGGEAGTGSSKKCSAGYVFVNNKGCMLDKCPAGYSQNSCSAPNPVQAAVTNAASGRLCYKCRTENCSDYPIASSCPPNAICSGCPDNSSNQKIERCLEGYKLSNNSCILKTCPSDFACYSTEICSSGVCKNDTCPVGYSKLNNCENGIEDAKNNLAGNPCYKCKTCPNKCKLSTCPDANAECNFETCSGKFCMTGCKLGYFDENAYWNNL